MQTIWHHRAAIVTLHAVWRPTRFVVDPRRLLQGLADAAFVRGWATNLIGRGQHESQSGIPATNAIASHLSPRDYTWNYPDGNWGYKSAGRRQIEAIATRRAARPPACKVTIPARY